MLSYWSAAALNVLQPEVQWRKILRTGSWPSGRVVRVSNCGLQLWLQIQCATQVSSVPRNMEAYTLFRCNHCCGSQGMLQRHGTNPSEMAHHKRRPVSSYPTAMGLKDRHRTRHRPKVRTSTAWLTPATHRWPTLGTSCAQRRPCQCVGCHLGRRCQPPIYIYIEDRLTNVSRRGRGTKDITTPSRHRSVWSYPT